MTAQAQPQYELPTQEQGVAAQSYLVEQIYAPAFFQKLAYTHNIQPRTRAEAQRILETTEVVRQARNAGIYKTATEAKEETGNQFLDHLFKTASDNLTQHIDIVAPERADQQLQSWAAYAIQQNDMLKAAACLAAYGQAGGEFAPD